MPLIPEYHNNGKTYRKDRDLEELHRLWLLAHERTERRNAEVKRVLLAIHSGEPDTSNGEYLAHAFPYSHPSYDKEKSWWVFRVSNDATDGSVRLIHSKKNVYQPEEPIRPELGKQLYYYLHVLATDWHWKLLELLTRAVSRWFHDNYTAPKPYQENYATVVLGGREYNVEITPFEVGGVRSVKWLGAVPTDKICLNAVPVTAGSPRRLRLDYNF